MQRAVRHTQHDSTWRPTTEEQELLKSCTQHHRGLRQLAVSQHSQ